MLRDSRCCRSSACRGLVTHPVCPSRTPWVEGGAGLPCACWIRDLRLSARAPSRAVTVRAAAQSDIRPPVDGQRRLLVRRGGDQQLSDIRQLESSGSTPVGRTSSSTTACSASKNRSRVGFLPLACTGGAVVREHQPDQRSEVSASLDHARVGACPASRFVWPRHGTILGRLAATRCRPWPRFSSLCAQNAAVQCASGLPDPGLPGDPCLGLGVGTC